MSARTIVRALASMGSLALGAFAACSTANNENPSSKSSAATSSEGNGSSHTGSQGSLDGGTPTNEGGLPPLLVDNMSADAGTRIALIVPVGNTPGSYYTYNDGNSPVTGTYQLVDTPISPPIHNADGTEITGDLCFGGSVLSYAGLGMSLVYFKAADAGAAALSIPVPFNATQYSGVSFYILVNSADSGVYPDIHFGIPDTQTSDPSAWPLGQFVPACAMGDAGCDDDFGGDVPPYTPGVWSKISFSWKPANANLMQESWGAQFNALDTSALIGMKWQANGGGQDAGLEPFSFCISDLYFTP
ncbi:MAG: hypothetical protein ABSF69_00285 [Polyangiaceae bacterium]|jgi:hypothetical protein